MLAQKKPITHVLALLAIGGVFFFVLHAVLDAIFLTIIEQEDDYCNEVVERYVGPDDDLVSECVDFKDVKAAAIWLLNKAEQKKKKWILSAIFGVAVALTWLVANAWPMLRGKQPYAPVRVDGRVDGNNILGLLLIAFILAFLAPLPWMLILPPPVDWFPSFLVGLEQARVDEVMEFLEVLNKQ